MSGWLARRFGAALLTIFAVLALTFTAIHLAPGTPFMPRGDRPPLDSATVARLKVRYGLDQPLPVQFAHYVTALSRGELGQSFSARRPVAEMLGGAIPNTLLLCGTALAIDLLAGFAIGVFQATRARRRADGALAGATLLVYSLPTFWLGLVLLLCFGEWLRWLPVGGVVDPAMHASFSVAGQLVDRLRHLLLPALTLGLVGAAATARFQRSATLDALRQDYMRVAQSKGISSRRLLQHALRNALLPFVTLAGLSLPFLLTGAVVVESVFAWPGMGKLAADAIATRDYPVVIATTLLASVLVVAGSFAADVLYSAVDPRTHLAAPR